MSSDSTKHEWSHSIKLDHLGKRSTILIDQHHRHRRLCFRLPPTQHASECELPGCPLLIRCRVRIKCTLLSQLLLCCELGCRQCDLPRGTRGTWIDHGIWNTFQFRSMDAGIAPRAWEEHSPASTSFRGFNQWICHLGCARNARGWSHG